MDPRIALALMPALILVGCTGSSSSGAGETGVGRSCQIRDSIRANPDQEVAEVREATCETTAGFLAPDVASIFVFVRRRSEPRDSSNIALRYEVVCTDTGGCDIAPGNVKWLSRSSLVITLPVFGDIYCVQRTVIGNFNISYSKTPLRYPRQDAFTDLKGLCQ